MDKDRKKTLSDYTFDEWYELDEEESGILELEAKKNGGKEWYEWKARYFKELREYLYEGREGIEKRKLQERIEEQQKINPVQWIIIFLILVWIIYEMITGDGSYSFPDDDNPYW